MINQTDQSSEPLLTAREVLRYLRISPITLYRMLKRGDLVGIKVSGQWRFRWIDLVAFVRHKLCRFGTQATKHLFFDLQALKKYRDHPQEYYLHDETFHGRVGSKQDYHDSKCWGVVIPPGTGFYELHYRKVPLEGGQTALALTPEQFATLPPAEQNHWASHRIGV